MLTPWSKTTPNMFMSMADQQTMRDFLIPNLLAFRAGLDDGIRRQIQEIRLIRSTQTGSYINGKQADITILVDTDLITAPTLVSDIKSKLATFAATIGLEPRVTVYDHAWLAIPSNETSVEDIRCNSLLVFKLSDSSVYITARRCIDSYYENSTDYDGRYREPHECDMLFEFITSFPLLSWSEMNTAIADTPINYAGVDDFVYQVVAKHISIWVKEYFLHPPKWMQNNCCFDSFGMPFNREEFDRENL